MAAHTRVNYASVDLEWGQEWIQLLCAPNFGHRFLAPPGRHQQEGIAMVGLGVVWIKLQGALVLALRARPVPIIVM